MSTYIEEMLKINRKFIRLFPDTLVYQQYDDGFLDFKVFLNNYLVTLLHSEGLEATYESLMEFANNSVEWDKRGYCHSEYSSDECTVSVEIESWKTKIEKGVTKPKFAIRSSNGRNWYKFDYRVYRQSSRKSTKMFLVYETHYEHKLINYLLKTGFHSTMEDIDEKSICDDVPDEVIAKQFISACKTYKMKHEGGDAYYEYGFIRKDVYVETYDDDMGCVVFMVYDEKEDDWVQVYKTYDINDMKSKLSRISDSDMWDVPLNEYERKDRWWV